VWRLKSEMKYPISLTFLFMNIEKMHRNDLSKELENLKVVLGI